MQRFWDKVDRSGGPDACWIWLAGTTSFGYGHFRFDGRPMGAHRVAWFLIHGPTDLDVLHRCDNPPCVNAERHLFLGTQADNNVDRHVKGRDGGIATPEARVLYPAPPLKGTRNGRSKLTVEQVQEIRRLRAEGLSYPKLGVAFGISHVQARNIVVGKQWGSV